MDVCVPLPRALGALAAFDDGRHVFFQGPPPGRLHSVSIAAAFGHQGRAGSAGLGVHLPPSASVTFLFILHDFILLCNCGLKW